MSESAESQVPAADLSGEEERKGGLSRYWYLPKPIKFIFVLGPVAAMILFILFWFSIPVGGQVLTSTRYYFILYAVLGFNIFMGLGATRAQKRAAPPWFDYILAFALWGIIIYYLIHHNDIGNKLWVSDPTVLQYTLATVVGLMAIECARRVGGWGFVGMVTFAVIYPLIADKIPAHWPISGYGMTYPKMIADYAYGDNGLLGLPAMILGHKVIGFYFFAGCMMGMGGGEFFLKLALALAGRFRGGPAKVAVLASGFFGSLSGSVVSNIAGTGSFTIPAMKRMGYEPEYAGAIEACASTGGDTMPPIMGGIFVMLVVAQVEYADVMIAAVIPSVLFYFGLLVQVDGYAANHGLRGMPREEIPPILKTLREGWVFLLVIAFLVFGLVYMRWGVIVPIYAIGLMSIAVSLKTLVLSCFSDRRAGETQTGYLTQQIRHGWKFGEGGLAHYASLLNFGTAIFIPMGFFMVGLMKTGMAARLTTWIIAFGGDYAYLMLFIGVVFSLVMGMVGLDRTSYLFLAVTLAPAVIELTGLPVIAVHLFLIYYGGMGGLTPPVAIHAYIAASIAGADPIRTSYKTVRLGIILAIFPWFFVFQPALIIINSTPGQIIMYLALALIGLWLLTSGLEGYLLRIGKLTWWERILFVVGGFLFAFPMHTMTYVGAAVCAGTVALCLMRKRAVPPAASLGPSG